MAPMKMAFDLTDKAWVDLYLKKCESIMKEFTNYVYALQHHCVEERNHSEKLAKDYKHLQTEVAKLNKEQEKTGNLKSEKIAIRTPEKERTTNNDSFDIKSVKIPTVSDADITAISDGSPVFLNMAMDSEQLQIDTTCILSPAQHRQELITVSEQLSSPTRLSTVLDSIGGIFQHNTSPTCKSKRNNENKGALGFLKARGRVGKTLLNDSREQKLREHNGTSSDDDNTNKLDKAKLRAKHSDWLGKDTKIEGRRAAAKRTSTGLDDIQRKRSLLSLNKSSERKLKQSRLTQIVAIKSNKAINESTSASPEYATNAQKLSHSPTTPAVFNTKKRLPFPLFSTDTDDIFHFSSDDDDDHHRDQIAAGMKQKVHKTIDATFLQPLPRGTEKSESVMAITPTAPPIICLDESEYGSEDENRLQIKPNIKVEPKINLKDTCTNDNKSETATTEKLPTKLAAAMLAEWEEEVENEEDNVNKPKLQIKSEYERTTGDTKSRLLQLPPAKISVKERFNIDCDECQKYVDFMGSNMTMAEIEAQLRRCTLHRTFKDCIPVTPPGYWNPLMPSFSESDPRNKTLLEDPFLQPKRK